MLFFSVKQQVSFSCCFVRATPVTFFVLFCLCNRYVFLLSTYGVPLAIAAFPFLSHLLASHSSELLFVLLCFLFSFLLFSLFLFFLWSGLLCCVLVPGTLALHLLYLAELRLFGLLCFAVCDHIISISLGGISTDSGCTDVY